MSNIKKLICLDLDGTIADTYPVFEGWQVATYGNVLPALGGPISIPKEMEREALRRWNEFTKTKYVFDIKPILNSQKALNQLKSGGYEFFVSTSRCNHPHLMDLTREFVDSHFDGLVNEIVHTSFYLGKDKKTGQNIYGKVDKTRICKNLGAGLIIEDSLFHAEDCSKNGIITLLLDTQGNFSGNESKLKKIVLVRNFLPEIVDKVEELYPIG